jgi:hypothetical protein
MTAATGHALPPMATAEPLDIELRALAAALEANRQLVELTGKLREENARLREDNARLLARVADRDAELDRVRADLAVLQRMLFGRSSERSRPSPARPGPGLPAVEAGGRRGAGGADDKSLGFGCLRTPPASCLRPAFRLALPPGPC